MFKKRLSQILSNPKMLRVAVVIGAVAIVLIYLSSYITIGDNSVRSTEEYGELLTDRLTEILSGVDGVGELRVFMTMENAGENRYQNNTDRKTESVTPSVRGVVVVCEGGDDPIVIARVQDAVTKSLSVSADKVCITKLVSE